jgi:hypothetical protein
MLFALNPLNQFNRCMSIEGLQGQHRRQQRSTLRECNGRCFFPQADPQVPQESRRCCVERVYTPPTCRTWRKQRRQGELGGLALKKRGPSPKEKNPLAARVAASRRGPWALSNTKPVKMATPNRFFAERGLFDLLGRRYEALRKAR